MFSYVGLVPPINTCALSWRELYESGAFFQSELEDDTRLARAAKTRGLNQVRLQRKHFEEWDETGVLRPIAFSQTAYMSGMTMPAIPSNELVFREEQPAFEPWEKYAWDAYGYPHVSAMFTPWQGLLLADAVSAGWADVPVEVLLRPDGRDEWAESYRWLFEKQNGDWTHLYEWWEPMLKVLVRLQNRYYPLVRGTGNVLMDEQGRYFDPGAAPGFDAEGVLGELGLTADNIEAAYVFFARRGQKLEPGDGAYLVRQMLPRRQRRKFTGRALLAQDFYDAGDVLRRFYRDLTDDVLPDAEVVADAHGDEELAYRLKAREKMLGHGPVLSFDTEDVKQVLHARGLYPHGIHAVVEGESEETLTRGVVEHLVGTAALDDLVVTNLRGVGGVQRVEELLSAVTNYALRTVVLLDNEGDVERVINGLVNDGALDRDDVLVLPESLEESNFSDDELVAIAADLAATPTQKRAATTLTLTGAELRAYHDDRLSRSGKQQPGVADSLQTLAQRQEHGAARFSKPELAEAILRKLLDEVASTTEQSGLDAVTARRPVLKHLIDRVAEPLFQAPSDRPRRRR